MKSTQHIRTILRAERARLFGMETVVSRPVRRTPVFATGR